MHALPAFQVRLRPGRGWALGLGLIGGLAALALLAAVRPHLGGLPALLASLLPLGWTAGLLRRGWGPARAAGCLLRWDGEGWLLQPLGPDGRPGAAPELPLQPPRVAWDLGPALLLALRPRAAGPWPAGLPRWLPLQAGACAGDWGALRAALYSARPAGPRPEGGPPTPPPTPT